MCLMTLNNFMRLIAECYVLLLLYAAARFVLNETVTAPPAAIICWSLGVACLCRMMADYARLRLARGHSLLREKHYV